MDQQPEINWQIHPYLVEFLVEFYFTSRLRPELLSLTSNIIESYVSRQIVYIKHYQLVSCAALWIAAKLAFIQMEGHVFATMTRESRSDDLCR
jgi:G2/mitotic-specific cyclin-B, other